MIKFKNNSDRIKKEWAELNKKNRDLREIVEYYSRIVWILWRKHCTLTDIFRTDAEQRKIYPGQPKKKSVHQFWRGVDVRDNLEYWQEEVMRRIINNKFFYDKNRPKLKTLLYHNVGRGSHGHIQNII